MLFFFASSLIILLFIPSWLSEEVFVIIADMSFPMDEAIKTDLSETPYVPDKGTYLMGYITLMRRKSVTKLLQCQIMVCMLLQCLKAPLGQKNLYVM